METKVIMYDADNQKVGETFLRRARQLVSKQRATWTDDTQTAIRFAPDDPLEMETDIIDTPSKDKDERLLSLAKQIISERHERHRFIWHTLALIPGYISIIFVINVMLAARNGNDYVFFLWGAWTMAYAIHAYVFIKPRWLSYRNLEGRYRQTLDYEIERLKRMGYDK